MASKFNFTLPVTPSFETISKTQRLIPLTNVIVEAMKTFNDPVSEIELSNQGNSKRLPVIKKAQNIHNVKLLKNKSGESAKQVMHTVSVQTDSITILPKSTKDNIPPLLQNKAIFYNDRFKHVTDKERKALMKIPNWKLMDVVLSNSNITTEKCKNRRNHTETEQVTKYQPTSLLKNDNTPPKGTVCTNPDNNLTKTLHNLSTIEDNLSQVQKSTEVTIPPLLQNKEIFCNDRFKHVSDKERKALMKIPNWTLMDVVLSNPTATASEKCKNRRNHTETEQVTKSQSTSLLKNDNTPSKGTEDNLSQGKATALTSCPKSRVEGINTVNFPQRCSSDFAYTIHNDLLYKVPQTSETEKKNPNYLKHEIAPTLGAKCSYKGSESLLSQPKKWKCTFFNDSSNKCSITSLNKSYKMTYSTSADLIWNKSDKLLDKACKPRCFKTNYLQYRHIDSPMSAIYEMQNLSELSKKDSSATILKSSEYSQYTIDDKARAPICDRPSKYKTIDAQNTNNNNSSRHLIRQMSIKKTSRLSTNLSGISRTALKTLKHNNHPKTKKILGNVITKGLDSQSSFSSNTKQILEQIKHENEVRFYNSMRTRADLWDTELQYQPPTMFPKCYKRSSEPIFRGIYEKKYSDNYYQARINCINKLNCTDGVNNAGYSFHLKPKPKRRRNPILQK